MQPGSYVFWIGRVDEDTVLLVALAHGLAGAPELGYDRGEASGHRLERGQAERLVERREREDGALLVLYRAVVFEGVLQTTGQDYEVRRLAQGWAPRESLDERQVVLFGIK